MAPEPTASTQDAFVLEVSSTRLHVLAYVNDYAIIQNPEGKDRVEGRKINAFLLEGRSEIRIDVAPTAEVGERRLDVELRVVRHGDEDSRRVILRHRYQALPSPLDENEAITVFRHALDVRRGLAPWAWQSARPYDASRDATPIAALVRRMIDALQRRDAAAAIELFRLKLEEESLATGMDPDTVRAEMRGRLEDMMAKPDYLAAVAPRLHVIPWSGGRLCDVRADRAQPSIFLMAPPVDLALDTTVSCIDGEWTFIR